MKILIIGSGGREHALSFAFAKSKSVEKIFCAPGNAGIAIFAECVNLSVVDIRGIADFAAREGIDLTFVGGETSLAAGIVDEFISRGLSIIGPTKAAAQLESSKSFAKDFMARHGIPRAKYSTVHTPEFAIDMLDSGDFGGSDVPVVIKADGLAAGKGVVVAGNRREAELAINGLVGLVGSDATKKIIIEECLRGREISLLIFSDGHNYHLMPACRDHKRLGEGDTGPNTGGMGTITDESLLNPEELLQITETIIVPTLRGCQREGLDLKGVLFLGIMMTDDGPKLLEYNVRFGDPEAQSLLVRLDTDLVRICEAIATGSLDEMKVEWATGSSACIILATEGYPGNPRVGDVISGLAEARSISDVEIFHAGTATDKAGNFVTNGGRILGVTTAGPSLATVLETAYSAVQKISWPGMQYRRDIGRPA